MSHYWLSTEGVFGIPDHRLDVFVVDLTGGDQARDLTAELRRAGFAADRAWGGRSMKAQMKVADRSQARFAVLVGSDEVDAGVVTVRDLRGGTGQDTVARDLLADALRSRLALAPDQDGPGPA